MRSSGSVEPRLRSHRRLRSDAARPSQYDHRPTVSTSVRSGARSAAGVSPQIYQPPSATSAGRDRVSGTGPPHRVDALSRGVRIFHLNGDELGPAIEQLECSQPGMFHAGYNIAFPAWELPRYPEEWARQLERFDEIWAASAFVLDSLRAAVSIPIIHLPNACEPHLTAPLQRDYFGLPEPAFLILFAFDLFSYHARKNPFAVIETFRRPLAAPRPWRTSTSS